MQSSAPCKIILFGEHAVVYDKLGIAAAIGERTFVEVLPAKGGVEIIRMLDPKDTKLTEEQLFSKLEKFYSIYEGKEFSKFKEFSFVDSLAVVVAECMKRYGYKSARVEIKFENMLKGVGRSASKYSALSLAVLRFLGREPTVEEVSEISYLGDVIVHAGMPSGIDTNTVALGGYVAYKKSLGVTRLNVDYRLPLVVIDSGTAAKTGAAVASVRKLMEEKAQFVNSIFDEIDQISKRAVRSLEEKQLQRLGSLMSRNHELLREIGVSTPRLDSIVQIGLDNGALGAKLTAAGQGGCAIALADGDEGAISLCSRYKESGFNAFTTSMGVEGVGPI
ncbi:MAG: mevalonate kinase [Candidatus Micrarchaeota archaeon]|nr:mevalonate kinase [Candidatus Micrarchaeota archaeon]